jgi:hypothetical protein
MSNKDDGCIGPGSFQQTTVPSDDRPKGKRPTLRCESTSYVYHPIRIMTYRDTVNM